MEEKKDEQLSNVERLQKQREGKPTSFEEQINMEREGRSDYYKSGGGFEKETFKEKMVERDAVVKANSEENLEKYKQQDAEKARTQNTKATNPNQKLSPENIGKETPSIRGGSGGRGGGSPIIKDLDELNKENQDAVDPEDTLSKKQDDKQQKQETQQQQAQHKPEMKEGAITQKLSVRERVDKAKGAKEPQFQKVDKVVEVGKDVKQIGIRERIAKAVAEKNNIQVEKQKPTIKEKTVEVAMSKAKQPSSKSIKR